MNVIKWKFNGIEIHRNPDFFAIRPEKKVAYRSLIDGTEVRISPMRDYVNVFLEVQWTMLDEEWRNKFHDWYMSDKKITIQSHLKDNPRDIWTVKIDEFNAPYIIGNPDNQRWDVTLKLSVVDADNDPILRDVYSESPHLFTVLNNTNQQIYDAYVFVRPLEGTSMQYGYQGKVAGDMGVPHVAKKCTSPLTPSPFNDVWSEISNNEYAIISEGGVHGGDFLDEGELVNEMHTLNEEHILDEGMESLNFIRYIFGLSPPLDVISIGPSADEYSCALLSFNLSNIDAYNNLDNMKFRLSGYADSGSLSVFCYNYINMEYDKIGEIDSPSLTQDDFVLQGDHKSYITGDNSIIFLVSTDEKGSALHIGNASIPHAYASCIINPSITQTFTNLIHNPGFESGMDGWTDESDSWEIDYVFYYEGAAGVKTNIANSPLYYESHCPPSENLTAMWTCRGDSYLEDAILVTVEYVDSAGNILLSENHSFDATFDYETHWFTTENKSPQKTVKARLKFEKQSLSQDYIYIDRTMLRLGEHTGEGEPNWDSRKHVSLRFNGIVGKGDVMRLNLGARTSDINGLESISDRIEGDWFPLAVGKSLLIFDDDGGSSLSEAVVRFQEVYV